MQLARPSAYFEVAGIDLLVRRSPHALGSHSVLQGIPDNSLRFGWCALPLRSWPFALLQSMTRKQPVARVPRVPDSRRSVVLTLNEAEASFIIEPRFGQRFISRGEPEVSDRPGASMDQTGAKEPPRRSIHPRYRPGGQQVGPADRDQEPGSTLPGSAGNRSRLAVERNRSMPRPNRQSSRGRITASPGR